MDNREKVVDVDWANHEQSAALVAVLPLPPKADPVPLSKNDQIFVVHLLKDVKLARLNERKATKLLLRKRYPQEVITEYLTAREVIRARLKELRNAQVPTSEREGPGAPRRNGADREEPQRLEHSDAGDSAQP